MSVTEAELIAGEAYQIIGDLALAANLYDHPEVQIALDWFSGFEPGVTYKDDASILPWPKEELKADDYSAITDRINALEEEKKELRAALILARGFIWSGGSTMQALANIDSVLAMKAAPCRCGQPATTSFDGEMLCETCAREDAHRDLEEQEMPGGYDV